MAACRRSSMDARPKPQSLEISAREIGDLMHSHASENLLVDLSIENDARAKRLALLQEIQRHPINGKVVHVDFHEVAEDEKVTVQVPIETVGEAAGVKNNGGVLEHVLFKLKVRCLPKDLPEQITVDVSSLEIGKTIHIGKLRRPRASKFWVIKTFRWFPWPRLEPRKKPRRQPPRAKPRATSK